MAKKRFTRQEDEIMLAALNKAKGKRVCLKEIVPLLPNRTYATIIQRICDMRKILGIPPTKLPDGMGRPRKKKVQPGKVDTVVRVNAPRVNDFPQHIMEYLNDWATKNAQRMAAGMCEQEAAGKRDLQAKNEALKKEVCDLKNMLRDLKDVRAAVEKYHKLGY